MIPTAVEAPGSVTQPKAVLPDKQEKREQMTLLNPSLIVPSLTNTRKVRNAEADAELLESVRLYGVIEPILVRPAVFLVLHAQALKQRSMSTVMKPGTECYELIAGERRWEAALRAGKNVVRSVIQSLSDEEALELQVVENDQREDLDPLDRAIGYRQLWEKRRLDHKGETTSGKPGEYVQYLAARLNRKPRIVYQIMKLADLSAEGQAALRSEKISISHAYELCRLTPVQQKNCLEEIDDLSSYGENMSVRELKDYIQSELYLRLDSAPFDTKSASLLPGVPPCPECPKNTAVDPFLAPETKKASCTDPVCYHQKADNHIHLVKISLEKAGTKAVRISAEQSRRPTKNNQFIPLSDWKTAESKKCPNAVTGILIDGEDEGYKPGDKLQICVTKTCKIHFPPRSEYAVYDAPPRRRVDGGELRKKIRANKLDQAIRTAQTKAIVEGIKELRTDDLRVVAITTFQGLHHGLTGSVCEAMGWKRSVAAYGYGSTSAFTNQINAAKPVEVAKVLVLMCLASEVLPGIRYAHSTPGKPGDFDKRHKLGLEKAKAKVTAELQAKFKEIDARRKAKEVKEKKA